MKTKAKKPLNSGSITDVNTQGCGGGVMRKTRSNKGGGRFGHFGGDIGRTIIPQKA